MARYANTHANYRQVPSGFGMQASPAMRWPQYPPARPGGYNEGFVDGFCDGIKKIVVTSVAVIPAILRVFKR